VITRLAVGDELNANNRERGEQDKMNKTAFVQNELENEPNNEKGHTNRPHTENLSTPDLANYLSRVPGQFVSISSSLS
jgi:hypothetical protein